MKKLIAILYLLLFGIVSYADEAYVYVRRTNYYVGLLVPIDISINGKYTCSLGAGKCVKITVPIGDVSLRFSLQSGDVFYSNKLSLSSGESIYIVQDRFAQAHQDTPSNTDKFAKAESIFLGAASNVLPEQMTKQMASSTKTLQSEASVSENSERDLQRQPEYGAFDYVPTKEGSKWGYKQLGKWVIKPRFDSAGPFSEGLACVKLLGKWGYINKSGELKIPFKYENALPFSEGLAPVMLLKRWGYINDTDELVIPFKYVKAKSFENSLAVVSDGNIEGFINKDNEWFDSKASVMASYKGFTKQYVENKVNGWQKKGKYEKTDSWKARVTEQNRKALIDKLVEEAAAAYIAEQSKQIKTALEICDYDADNEVFLINDSKFGNLLVQVPINEAESFSNEFDLYERNNVYRIEGDGIGLDEINFTKDGKTYSYKNTASLQFAAVDIDYSFETVDFDIKTNAPLEGKQTIVSRNEKMLTKSDVDMNIPTTSVLSANTFAVIIANENYRREKGVDYALNDGNAFCEYCKKTLGIPEKNIRICTDATFLDMKAEVDWLTNISKMYAGEARLVFYYAGHGIPDEGSKDAYLLPVDGMGSNPSTGYKLSDLYASLGESNSKSSVVFLDACFSGAQRNGEMMASARGVAIKAKAAAPKGNMVVLSAATGDETAYPFYEKGHGMFTYYLLKILQDTNGEATLGEISDYVITQVSRKSMVENSKSQTPTAMASANLEEDWRDMKLF